VRARCRERRETAPRRTASVWAGLWVNGQCQAKAVRNQWKWEDAASAACRLVCTARVEHPAAISVDQVALLVALGPSRLRINSRRVEWRQ